MTPMLFKKPKKSTASIANSRTSGPVNFAEVEAVEEVPKSSIAGSTGAGASPKRNRSSRKKSTLSHTTRHTRGPSTSGKRNTSRESHDTHRKKSKLKSIQRQTVLIKEPTRHVPFSVRCDALHDGRLFIQANLHYRVDVLFNMLFTSTTTFLNEFHAMRNTKNLSLGPWHPSKDGQQSRVVSMIVALQANVGPKTSKVTEVHTMRKCSVPGELYAIDVVSTNEGIPYADIFNILMHYCLMRSPNNSTDFLVYGNVNFVKSTWAVVKAFILKHSNEGMAEFFHDLHQQLLKEVDKRGH